jgi:hypothetical protein
VSGTPGARAQTGRGSDPVVSPPGNGRGRPVDCLRSVISGRVLNRLGRADGRGVPVAPSGPPATVGDVARLYREGRFGEIAGLGARGISEIEAGLVFVGLLLDGSTLVRQQPRTRATAPGLAAVTAGTGQSAARVAGGGGPAPAAEAGRYPGHTR